MRGNRSRIGQSGYPVSRQLPFGIGVGSRVYAPGGTGTIIGVNAYGVEVRLDTGRVVSVDTSQVRYVR